MISEKDIQQQSVNAWNQWRSLWIDNARANGNLLHDPLSKYLDHCKGEVLVQAAFGHSLSTHLDTIKEYRNTIKIMCCDKAFGYLSENGIVPDYCLIADASVSMDWIGTADTSKTILFSNIAAKTDWTSKWEGPRVFYVNWDNLGTAKILGAIGRCREVIPASSNVSNAQIVLASQVLNPKVQILTGYDYSWQDDGNYYASMDSEKRHYMHHIDAISPYGNIVKTSSNLSFSCNWLMQYLYKFGGLNIINASERGLLDIDRKMPMRRALESFVKKEVVKCR